MTQQQNADRFRAMHIGPEAFVLPNAWDAASAVILEDAGFPAIATTSAGIAFARGYRDGQNIPKAEMMDEIGRIASVVSIPVTADIEAGYDNVGDTVTQAIAAGAVGVNLEDGTGEPEEPLSSIDDMYRCVTAARIAATDAGLDIVINARTDGFLVGGAGDDVLSNAVLRANAYLGAGADCAFVPGVQDLETIATLAKRIDGPLNVVVAREGMPDLARLQQAGVRRVSLGGSLMRAMSGHLDKIARDLRVDGAFGYVDEAMPHRDLNRMFPKL